MSDSALDFEGQSVVVTGGATGIGEACARLFAGRGASVTVMDIDAEGAERVAGEVRAAGGGRPCLGGGPHRLAGHERGDR